MKWAKMRLRTAIEVLDVELDFKMCIIRLRLMVPVTRTTELMARRAESYSLSLKLGAAVLDEIVVTESEMLVEFMFVDSVYFDLSEHPAIQPGGIGGGKVLLLCWVCVGVNMISTGTYKTHVKYGALDEPLGCKVKKLSALRPSATTNTSLEAGGASDITCGVMPWTRGEYPIIF
ncbi:hypothetical protein INR49_032909 [Caranx melampygus]|nr:hypothetical protein INR49_032909 [Caranx melampygus]